jgi:hypothetical protein
MFAGFGAGIGLKLQLSSHRPKSCRVRMAYRSGYKSNTKRSDLARETQTVITSLAA